ncbi:acyl-CoA ligase (AMP-forming), exosortase A system-associated [Chromatocurvus halotolerans]|uniref:Acyl-CoA ligase (AMP-forming) (Exosortase A-associated) n=1 Tax=Chromatocurvus halotolerans TaxID=1132028 RepID=A0A4R2KTE8_9GAMM|nr:acyl-CoA ligase (AMP-forming), exosortase A system-associated [Chromatocurvus halotolerans]TCO74349.1 acyl-CoA ligase (AMP-forming) (exosortase A-associated) [Chromatocurvus halotolerans]
MADQLHELIRAQAEQQADAPALLHKNDTLTYGELHALTRGVANGLLQHGIKAGERVGIYLPKQPEAVAAIFGSAHAGATFVPINPVLKPRQVAYIANHCQVRTLITSAQRWQQLRDADADLSGVQLTVLLDGSAALTADEAGGGLMHWQDFLADRSEPQGHRRIDQDMAAILYTSGSTGNPKGVVLSHRNMLVGADSVATYLENTAADRILAVLPLSFDAGLSQLTTAFSRGASCVLLDYLLPRDVIRAVARYGVTGLAGVPPLWNQLVQCEWPEEATRSLRYITNTGGKMPVATTRTLQRLLPDTRIFLMYGLTEAFRSTYLDPAELEHRPESIGKAIPNAEILVVNGDGELCAPGEPGELVHRGALVARGYWNDPEKTAERFRPCPGQDPALPLPEMAVWSGDQVVRDEDGFLYFVARQDDMIKTSGYRVSPSEVEEVAYASGLVAGAVALGVAHAMLGQAILLLVTRAATLAEDDPVLALQTHFRRELPNFMQPQAILLVESLPQNQNGKFDRRSLSDQHKDHFEESA